LDASKEPSLFARVVEPESGRVMEVFTTQPGVQLYTAKHLSDRYKTANFAYAPYHGLCLETQNYPDAPNKQNFPSPILRPGQVYEHTTIHKFSIQK
ncbi:MAG: aldose epimerase family protein, partial [Planctomycetota bacterium]